MEAKFTPGPWHIDHAIDCKGEDGYRYVFSPRGDLGAFIAKIRLKPWPKEQEANARLIAAAPDMYEELECAKDVFRFYQSHHEFKGGTEKAIRNKEIADRIDRLLEKARGEA